MKLNWEEKVVLDEVESTQDFAAAMLENPGETSIVIGLNQTLGRGRFGRAWISKPGDSLTMSMIFREYPDHPRPWLIGMNVALVVASTLHTQLRWPNDLTIRGKKVGGILTELVNDSSGRKIPVVGIGINLNQAAFDPPIGDIATSLFLERHHPLDPMAVAQGIVQNLQTAEPPTHWSNLLPAWRLFDDTPGKIYRVPTGERAVAIGIGPEGDLICAIDGETTQVMAAEAIFGTH